MKTFIIAFLFLLLGEKVIFAQDSLNVLEVKGIFDHGYIWQRVDSTSFDCTEYFIGEFTTEAKLQNKLDNIYADECSDKKQRLTIMCYSWLVLIISYDNIKKDGTEEVIFSGKITAIDYQNVNNIRIDNFIIQSGTVKINKKKKRVELQNLELKEYGRKI